MQSFYVKELSFSCGDNSCCMVEWTEVYVSEDVIMVRQLWRSWRGRWQNSCKTLQQRFLFTSCQFTNLLSDRTAYEDRRMFLFIYTQLYRTKTQLTYNYLRCFLSSLLCRLKDSNTKLEQLPNFTLKKSLDSLIGTVLTQ